MTGNSSLILRAQMPTSAPYIIIEMKFEWNYTKLISFGFQMR